MFLYFVYCNLTILLLSYYFLFIFYKLLYLDSTKFDSFPVVRVRPAIKNWNSYSMKRRQDLELKEQVIGQLELHEEWTENEARETEGFVVGDAVKRRPRLDSFAPATDKQVCDSGLY